MDRCCRKNALFGQRLWRFSILSMKGDQIDSPRFYWWVYETGRQEEEGSKTFLSNKHNRAMTCVFCRDLHLTPMFSGPVKKDLFKGK